MRETLLLTNLIVTGGAGFIGANFVRYALEHSEAVITVLDKLTYAGHRASLPLAEYPERLQLVEADITDRSAVDALLERSGALRHLAAAARTLGHLPWAQAACFPGRGG